MQYFCMNGRIFVRNVSSGAAAALTGLVAGAASAAPAAGVPVETGRGGGCGGAVGTTTGAGAAGASAVGAGVFFAFALTATHQPAAKLATAAAPITIQAGRAPISTSPIAYGVAGFGRSGSGLVGREYRREGRTDSNI